MSFEAKGGNDFIRTRESDGTASGSGRSPWERAAADAYDPTAIRRVDSEVTPAERDRLIDSLRREPTLGPDSTILIPPLIRSGGVFSEGGRQVPRRPGAQ